MPQVAKSSRVNIVETEVSSLFNPWILDPSLMVPTTTTIIVFFCGRLAWPAVSCPSAVSPAASLCIALRGRRCPQRPVRRSSNQRDRRITTDESDGGREGGRETDPFPYSALSLFLSATRRLLFRSELSELSALHTRIPSRTGPTGKAAVPLSLPRSEINSFQIRRVSLSFHRIGRGWRIAIKCCHVDDVPERDTSHHR